MSGFQSLEDLLDRVRRSEAGEHLGEAADAQRRALVETGRGLRSLVDLDTLAAMPREFVAELIAQGKEVIREQARDSPPPSGSGRQDGATAKKAPRPRDTATKESPPAKETPPAKGTSPPKKTTTKRVASPRRTTKKSGPGSGPGSGRTGTAKDQP